MMTEWRLNNQGIINCLPSVVAAVLVSGLAEDDVELDKVFLEIGNGTLYLYQSSKYQYELPIFTLIVSVLLNPLLM